MSMVRSRQSPTMAQWNDGLVLRRTGRGQDELVWSRLELDPGTRRFLAMVNGYTPLRVMVQLGFERDDVTAAASTLLDHRLVEPVPPVDEA